MVNQKHRIWALIRLYYPNFSGAAIQAHRILHNLVDSNREVVVLTVADHISEHLTGQTKILDNVRVRYLRILKRRDWKFFRRLEFVRSKLRYMSQLLSDLTKNVNIAWKLWRNGKPGDMALLYSVDEFSLIVVAVCRWKKIKSVIQMSLVGADDPGSFPISRFSVLTKLKIRAFHRADLIIGLSSALTSSCAKAGIAKDKILRIPNGVDPSVFCPNSNRSRLKSNLGLSTQRIYMIFVGTALHRKGIDVLINAFLRIAGRFNDVDLLIAGDHELLDGARNDQSRRDLVAGLKEQISTNGLEARVHWLGQIENVDQYLQAADIFFFPTRREGLPNALAEAMASQLAVVASNIPGVTTDLIRDGVDGILVDGYNAHDYVVAITRLLENPQQASSYAASAVDRIVNEFSLSVVTERYRQLANSAMSEQGFSISD